jgi:hypothetical protein
MCFFAVRVADNAKADLISVTYETTLAKLNQDGVDDGTGTFVVGEANLGLQYWNSYPAFALPTLSLGESITAGKLVVQLTAVDGPPSFNVDIYGLGTRSTAPGEVTFGTDYLLTNTPDTHPRLFDDAVTPSASPGSFEFDVTSYVQSQYTGNVPNDNFLYFRLNPDATPGGNLRRYLFSHVENPPTLELTTTTVPEPNTFTLAALGLLTLGFYWWRGKRT